MRLFDRLNNMISLASLFSVESGNMNLIVAMISLISIAIPLISGYSFVSLDDSIASDAVISDEAQISYGMLAVAIVPLLIDTLSDYNDIYSVAKWKRYIFGRVPIAFMGMLMSIQLCVNKDTPSIFGLTNDSTASYFYCLTCFRIVFTACLMFMLTTVKPTIFQGWLTTFITSVACVISSIRMYTPGSTPSFCTISLQLTYVCLAVLATIMLYFVYELIKTRKQISVEDYTCMIYLSIYLLALAVSYVSVFQTRSKDQTAVNFTDFTARDIAIINDSFVLLYILLTIAPGRIARFEAVIHLVS